MVEHIGNLFTFIGGVGMFLYGMKNMSEGLQKIAGTKLSNILKILTTNRFLAIAIGALVTAILHSSGATTVMVVGFVNAGIIELSQAVGVIMGANIGTTITAWMVSLTQLGSLLVVLKPAFYAPFIFGVSALVIVFSKKEKSRTKASIFLGIGLLFLGLTLMASGVSSYAESRVFKDAFEILGKYPLLAILAGCVVTAILSSSTASVSILQTLALAGSVSRGAACFITVGQNIGTCITTILSSTKASKNGKRAALIHLLFNVLGALIFSVIVLVFYSFLKDMLDKRINLVEISIFHTGFNMINTLILLPFADKMVSITKKILPDKDEEETELDLSEKTSAILDERILNEPAVAISTTRKEVIFFANYTFKNLRRATALVTGERSEELINEVIIHEEQIDKTTKILTDYLMKINNLSVSEKQIYEVEQLMSICSDVERIGDHAENISENANELLINEIDFSDAGKNEIAEYIRIALESVEYGIKSITDKNMEDVKAVREREELADGLEDEYRTNHLKRLAKGVCSSLPGIIFLDILGNLERVTDHANNLADYIEAELNQKKIKEK